MNQVPKVIAGRRVVLRPLLPGHFGEWRDVRRRNTDWLLKWEPKPAVEQPDDTSDRTTFAGRCGAREREWQLGTGYGFGIFVRASAAESGSRASAAESGSRASAAESGSRASAAESGDPERLAGEINLSGVQRGPFQNAYVGYWIDRARAGEGLVPESLVVACRFAFEDVGLHRLQVAIIPRNQPSRRVVEKLKLREEGLAQRYLAINGVWEDHIRYAITAEEWAERREELLSTWVW